VNLVAEGQPPKDLGDQLKRIEKLAKHLRSEVSDVRHGSSRAKNVILQGNAAFDHANF
jgi:hypothetical protein